MPNPKTQIVAHKDYSVELPAIVRKVFSLVIRPPWTILKWRPIYQVIHKTTGYHIASFVVSDSAIGFFRDIDYYLPSFTNSEPERLLVKRLLTKWQAHEKRHQDYSPDASEIEKHFIPQKNVFTHV